MSGCHIEYPAVSSIILYLGPVHTSNFSCAELILRREENNDFFSYTLRRTNKNTLQWESKRLCA